MPYFAEPAEAITDLSTSEIILLKSSQAGGSENLLLNAIRYHVARDPIPILYVGAQQEGTEEFNEERIKAGLKCSKSTSKKLRRARERGSVTYFDDMQIVATWAKSVAGLKQRSIGLALCDEVSTYPLNCLPKVRKRLDTYPFSHLVAISSPDPKEGHKSNDDAIFIEFEDSDQRYWFMEDPDTKELFRFEMGSNKSVYGLKWDPKCKREDGSWDYDMVYETAHYVTPSGAVILNEDKAAVISTGKWVATNPQKARKGKRGYHLNQFYVPFRSGDFGHIAVKFLEAKAAGKAALRVFIYEFLAEKWTEEVDRAESEEVEQRAAEYSRGDSFAASDKFKDIYIGKETIKLMTQDVQKGHFWWVVREWVKGGDSGLVDYDYAVTWDQVEDRANHYEVFKWFCDYGYKQIEVFENALLKNFIPVKSFEKIQMPYHKKLFDPFEGTSRQNTESSIVTYSFRKDVFATITLDMMNNQSEHSWFLYSGIDREYIKQVTAEEKVDGIWKIKRGHADNNHLWDCEVLQTLAAHICRFCTNVWFD